MKVFFRLLMLLIVLFSLFVMAISTALASNGAQAAPPVTLTPENLAAIVGTALSLVFAYLPWVKDWYDGLDGKVKAALMGLMLIVTTAGVFALQCGQVVSVGITCDKSGTLSILTILLAALMANQGTYLLAVRPYKK